MRYCNLKFGYNKASVKSTAFQFENCTGNKTHLGKQNHTKTYWNIKCACKLYGEQTTPWQGVYFFTNTVKVGAE